MLAYTSSLERSSSSSSFRNADVPPSAQMNANAYYAIANGKSPAGLMRGSYRGEFFDVLSPPIKYNYSQVFWTVQEAVPLPPDLVKRFDDKVMVVTGYEFDVVYVDPVTKEHKSVPCYHHYNHHYIWYWWSKYSKPQDQLSAKVHMHGGHQPAFDTSAWKLPLGLPSDDVTRKDIPAAQWFSEGNGNEARTSYHGYPRGWGQLIDSPTHIAPNPMMINTKGVDGPRSEGPLPRVSKSHGYPKDAPYSPLVECPCTTRIPTLPPDYKLTHETCPVAYDATKSAQQCHDAVSRMQMPPDVTVDKHTVNQKNKPRGCTLEVSRDGTHVDAVWNDDSDALDACGSNGDGMTAVARTKSLVQVSVKLDGWKRTAHFELSGPSDRWFAVGFDAQFMMDLPYTIVVDADGDVMERKLGNHDAGKQLKSTLVKESDEVRDGIRTVKLRRGMKGETHEHRSFTLDESDIPFINALGTSRKFAPPHHGHASSRLVFLRDGSRRCVCRGNNGTMGGVPFQAGCWPESDVERQNNPSCDIRYSGGLKCCRHLEPLLDADQEMPNSEDTVYMKSRWYFEEYKPEAPQRHLMRLFWMTETWNGEYDVPQAPRGTPPHQAIHRIESRFTVYEMMGNGLMSSPGCSLRTDINCADPDRVDPNKGVELVYAGGHCHGPACLSIELWNDDTGMLVCKNSYVEGKTDGKWDERGYGHIPPCVWGDPKLDAGLVDPPRLFLNTTLRTVQTYNSTYKHTGVMAFWQMRGAYGR
mmetsp:Transcript_5349/g.12259  ORF Transcript_5349/g.12259 Transcript_5349/m.12259 type:complete len:752 (-) Transcript_5349:68-2323(-)